MKHSQQLHLGGLTLALVVGWGGVTAMCPGCVSSQHTSGTAIRDDLVSQLVKGKTTMEEVIALFGEPIKATPMGAEMIYTYEHKISRSNTAMFPIVTASDTKDEADKLSIVFDKNNVVKTFNLTRGIGKAH